MLQGCSIRILVNYVRKTTILKNTSPESSSTAATHSAACASTNSSWIDECDVPCVSNLSSTLTQLTGCPSTIPFIIILPKSKTQSVWRRVTQVTWLMQESSCSVSLKESRNKPTCRKIHRKSTQNQVCPFACSTVTELSTFTAIHTRHQAAESAFRSVTQNLNARSSTCTTSKTLNVTWTLWSSAFKNPTSLNHS